MPHTCPPYVAHTEPEGFICPADGAVFGSTVYFDMTYFDSTYWG